MNPTTIDFPPSNGQRHNPLKHGLLADGITPLDDAEHYMDLLGELTERYQPEGPLEAFLLDRMALCMTRLNRAAFLEAEYIASRLAARGATPDPTGTQPQMTTYQVENLNKTYHRYETAIQNKLFQTLKQFNQLRQGDAEGFTPAEGAAPSRPRRCRRRPGYMTQKRPTEAPETPPGQVTANQPDPTITPLHYQTDSGRDSTDAVRHDASPFEPSESLPGRDPATAGSPFAGAQNLNPTLESPVDSSSLPGRDGMLPSPISLDPAPPVSPSTADSSPFNHSTSPTTGPCSILTSRLESLVNDMDLTNLKEWVQDNPGRLLEFLRLAGFQAYQAALSEKVRLEITKLNDAIKAAQPQAPGSLTEPSEEEVARGVTAYARAMAKCMGIDP
jgi:hypothetical protein